MVEATNGDSKDGENAVAAVNDPTATPTSTVPEADVTREKTDPDQDSLKIPKKNKSMKKKGFFANTALRIGIAAEDSPSFKPSEIARKEKEGISKSLTVKEKEVTQLASTLQGYTDRKLGRVNEIPNTDNLASKDQVFQGSLGSEGAVAMPKPQDPFNQHVKPWWEQMKEDDERAKQSPAKKNFFQRVFGSTAAKIGLILVLTGGSFGAYKAYDHLMEDKPLVADTIFDNSKIEGVIGPETIVKIPMEQINELLR